MIESWTRESFKGKRILIMGLGLHGGGCAAARWFYTQGARVCVTDTKSKQELEKSIQKLNETCRSYALTHNEKELFPIEYVLGTHREEDFLQSDLIIQNPAVPSSSRYLQLARERSIPIEIELSFFFLLTPKTKKIGITGTRGKSTTTLLIFEILKHIFPQTHVAGVALGEGTVPFFDILDSVCDQEEAGVRDPVILECSSFQLEFLNTRTGGPELSLITNVYPDHLNRYGSLDEYVDAKKNIFQHSGADSILILNYDNPLTRAIGMGSVPGTRVWFSRIDTAIDGVVVAKKDDGDEWLCYRKGDVLEYLCPRNTCTLLGDHNLENALAALALCRSLSVDQEDICKGLKSFTGVLYRQQYVATIKGRVCINDTTATSPDGACAALKTVGSSEKKNIILLAGGSDKGLEFEGFAREIKKYVKTLILFSGTATPHLMSALTAISFEGKVELAQGMEEAVTKAWNESSEGDTILLSPGAASFGMFHHEFDRGDQFNQALSLLEQKQK